MTGKLEKRRGNVTYKRTQQISRIKTAAECQLVDCKNKPLDLSDV